MPPRCCAAVAAAAALGAGAAAAPVKCGAGDSAAGIAAGRDLTGQVVLLTGGDSGIGYETALALAASRASIVIASYDAQGRGREAASNITRLTGNAAVDVVQVDLASFGSVRACAAAVRAKYPRLDTLICDAGIGGPSATGSDVTADGFERVAQVNYLGHFLLVDLLLPALRAGGAGRIISVSSGGAMYACSGKPGLTANCTGLDSVAKAIRPPLPTAYAGAYYGVSKWMQIYHMRELAAREAARGSGVTAYSIRPGLVETPMTAGMTPAQMKQMCQYQPYSPCPIPAANGADSPTYLAAEPQLPAEANGDFLWMCESCAKDQSIGCPWTANPAWTPWTAEEQRRLFDLSLQWVGAATP